MINATGIEWTSLSPYSERLLIFPKGCLVTPSAYFPAKTHISFTAQQKKQGKTLNGLRMLSSNKLPLPSSELMTDKLFLEEEVWQALKLEYPDYGQKNDGRKCEKLNQVCSVFIFIQ